MLAAEFRVAVSPVIATPVLRRLLPAFARLNRPGLSGDFGLL